MKLPAPKYKLASIQDLIKVIALSSQTCKSVILPRGLNYLVTTKEQSTVTFCVPYGGSERTLKIGADQAVFTDKYGVQCLRASPECKQGAVKLGVKCLWDEDEDEGHTPKKVRVRKPVKPAEPKSVPRRPKRDPKQDDLGMISDAIFATSTRTVTGKLKVDALLAKGVIPKGREAMSILNDNGRLLRWESKTAGYWRDKASFRKSDGDEVLPFPVITTAVGYVRKDFLARLEITETSHAFRKQYRGWSTNRWTGEANGSGEYQLSGWSWPEGYKTYLKAGVLPSREFYKFIMGKDLASLPSYNKE